MIIVEEYLSSAQVTLLNQYFRIYHVAGAFQPLNVFVKSDIASTQHVRISPIWATHVILSRSKTIRFGLRDT